MEAVGTLWSKANHLSIMASRSFKVTIAGRKIGEEVKQHQRQCSRHVSSKSTASVKMVDGGREKSL